MDLLDLIRKQINALPSQSADLSSSKPLVDRVTAALQSFPKYYAEHHSSVKIESEAQLMGALSGFLSSVLSGVQTTTGRIFRTSKPHYVDIVISSANQTIIVELKRGNYVSLVERGVVQLSTYLNAANAKYGILFLYSDMFTEYDVTAWSGDQAGTEIYIVRPAVKP